MVDLVKKFQNMDGCIVQVQRGVKLRLTTIQGKCGFFKPSKGGWADIKYWTLVEQVFQESPDKNTIRVGHSFVAETQLILNEYLNVKKKMHLVYACSRGDFNTSKIELEAARKTDQSNTNLKSSHIRKALSLDVFASGGIAKQADGVVKHDRSAVLPRLLGRRRSW